MAFGTSLPARMPESDGTLTLHVSPTGNDTTGTGSLIAPYKTDGKAWIHPSLGAGSIIYLRGNAGEHGASSAAATGEAATVAVTNKFGSPTNPITMETYPGDPNAIINGTRFHLNPGDLKQNDYNSGNGWNVRIRNLEFKNNNSGGEFGINALEHIKSNNARNFEIYGCTFHDAGSQGVLIRGMGRETTLTGAMLASTVGAVETITIAANTNFLNAVPFYVGISASGAVGSWSNVTEVVKVTNVNSLTWTIERGALGTPANVAHANASGVAGMWQHDNVQIINCKFYNCGMQGTTVNGTQSVSTGSTLTVTDTTIFPATGALSNSALVVAGVAVALPYSAKTATTFTIGTITGTHSAVAGSVVLNSWAASHAHGIYYGSDAGGTAGAIYNCLSYDNAAFGLTLHENAEGCIVANNTFDGNGRGAVDIAGELTHGTKNCVIKNNVCTNSLLRSPISGTSQSGWAFNVWYASATGVWTGVTTANNVVDKNLHYANANPTNSGYHTSDTGDWPVGSVVFTNATNSDPLFTNRAAKTFTLTTGTPASGIGDGAYTPATDYAGTTRVAADAGAFAAPAAAALSSVLSHAPHAHFHHHR